MIISPPFLPTRLTDATDAEYVATAMPSATINCPGTNVPEGSFPISLKLGWHGGTHLHAPSANSQVLPLRAIADGEIVYARLPTARVEDPAHPLNYNPYGASPAWTDDGMVIMRHRTDIGTDANAEAVEFYSLFAHLSVLRGNALKVARGTANKEEHLIYRKDELGAAGRIYNAADHVQMEILCDDNNLHKLVGRTTGKLELAVDGRHDSVYGEVYFHVPAGARLYADEPEKNVTVPSTTVAETTATDLIIGLRYGSGDGAAAQRGSAWLTTYQLNGTILGSPIEIVEEEKKKPGKTETATDKKEEAKTAEQKERDRIIGERLAEMKKADYNVFALAGKIHEALPQNARPAASAVYEMLRFGRVLNTPEEAPVPADCPHWRKIQSNGKVGWINLNASNVRKFSDADFPDWKGWKLIDDDVDDDSRAHSALLSSVIEGASAAGYQLSADELQRCMSIPTVRMALSHCICKFPSEWVRDSIDARWGWLQSDEQHGVVGDDWAKLREHMVALTVPTPSLPTALTAAHWHFQPQNFITHFRKCHWLSAGEFKQLIPMNAMRCIAQTLHIKKYAWEPVGTVLESPTSIYVSHRINLNRMARKYGINSPLRLSSFYGNALPETQWFGKLAEGSGPSLWYAPWYGRGFLQLTGPENYINYWRFRGRQISKRLMNDLSKAWVSVVRSKPRSNEALKDTYFSELTAEMLGWRDEVQGITMRNSTDSRYAPSDSAGFYWAKLGMACFSDADHLLEMISVTTNHGDKVYYRSPSFWRASAAVNLPGNIDKLYSDALNGFEARCVAYAYSLAVLSEISFPDSSKKLTLTSPQGYLLRRTDNGKIKK